MKFKFSWLNSRKTLFLSSLIDFFLLNYLFFGIFKESISNQVILVFLTISNSLFWIFSSYINGRYTNLNIEKSQLLFNQFFKTFLNICFNLFFTLILFRIFWNWNYMKFASFSNFLNDFLSFYLRVFIFSSLSQLLFSIYLSKKFSKSSIWYFLGNKNKEDYFNQIIGFKKKFTILNFEQRDVNDQINAKGIIVDDEQLFKKKNIKFLFELNNKGLKFLKVSNWCERYLNRYPSELIQTNEIIEGIFTYDENSFKARIKRILESVLSLLILFFTLPLIFIAALSIKLEDGGPIFYSQIRNGFEGKQFKIIKLRTMIINAEKDGIQWADKSDARITNTGRILRKLRIDELPQLLLVLSGEMSLIGPRPERPEIDDLLREHISNYDLRYCIKPGISGWAQVNCPYGASIEDSKLKLSYDIYYIKNFSILLDFMIFFKTVKLVLNAKGSIPKRKNSVGFH